jgi:mannose-6-phosphate isomerase-like protein (cupin superfamily)
MYIPSGFHKDQERPGMRGGQGTVTMRPIAAEGELPEKCRLFGKLILPAGASIGAHTHEGECEMFYILEGNPVITDDGVEIAAHPGDCVLTHSGHSHAVSNPGDTPVVMVANIVKD